MCFVSKVIVKKINGHENKVILEVRVTSKANKLTSKYIYTFCLFLSEPDKIQQSACKERAPP